MIYGEEALHCYQIDSGNWVEYQTITEPDAFIYGRRFQFTEEYLVVGAPGNTFVYPDNSGGEVFLYKKVSGYWVPDTVLSTNDELIYEFGGDVFLDSNRIAIKAKSGTHGNFETVVYVFALDGGNWLEETVIPNPTGSTGFGYSIAMDDDTIYIGDGNFYHDYYGEYTGIVYEYRNEGDSWNMINAIEPSSPVGESQFGTHVYKTGNLLFVGASGQNVSNDYPGYVYVFEKSGDDWVLLQLLSPNDGAHLDIFGASLTATNNLLAVGAPANDDAGNGSGSVYIFSNLDGVWQEINKIIPTDANYGDFFGDNVSMTQDFVFVSAPLKNGLEGAVYVYDPRDTSLHANFAGYVRSGNAPVTVQFTSVPQGNPTAYDWDFNSDGFVDSTEPNPQFTYQIDGIYSVTLTVYDESGSDEEVKIDYIQVVSDILFGDVDQSGSLDVGDLVLFVAFVLGDAEPTEDQFLSGDVNYSGQIDIIDIVMVIHEILN